MTEFVGSVIKILSVAGAMLRSLGRQIIRNPMEIFVHLSTWVLFTIKKNLPGSEF